MLERPLYALQNLSSPSLLNSIMQPVSAGINMDPFALIGVQQEYTSSRKLIHGEPSKEKEQSSQYSPQAPQPSASSPKAADIKKRKRGRPPLEKDSRLCTNCGTSETPEWRKGPLGPHTLCNACGLQWMKAQKREHEIKSKYEEARKKNSLMRVLNSHANSQNATAMQTIEPPPHHLHQHPHSTSTNVIEMGDTSDINCRYSPEMDTLPADALSPTMSPMQAMPMTMDTLNTLKAIQTISALSQMNHLNHINTLNHHINVLSTGYPDIPQPSPSSSAYSNPSPTHTVINHYNANINTYNSNAYNLTPNNDMSNSLTSRYPINPQQIFLPMNYANMLNSSAHNPFNPYMQQQQQQQQHSSPLKDYTLSSSASHLSNPPPPSSHHMPAPNMIPHPSSNHTHHTNFYQNMSNSTLLHPNPHNLIPNPSASINVAPILHHHNINLNTSTLHDDSSNVTGGGQM